MGTTVEIKGIETTIDLAKETTLAIKTTTSSSSSSIKEETEWAIKIDSSNMASSHLSIQQEEVVVDPM